MLKNKIIKELKIHYVDLMTADFLLVLLKTYILFVIIEVAYILTKVARVAKLDFMGENGLHNEAPPHPPPPHPPPPSLLSRI